MLTPGTAAPEFTLESVEGRATSLASLVERGPAAVVFFKAGCPTCQFTFPFLNRLAALKAAGLTVVAVSQDDAAATRQFLERYGMDVPALVDEQPSPGRVSYPTSKAFQITHVPSIFVVEPDRRILMSAHGFNRAAMEELGKLAGQSPFRPGEEIPEVRPG